MAMPGRNIDNEKYRYGFNGKENDKDINSGAIAFEARIYDSRIGRWFSTDPREAEYTWQSTYVYFKNCPISILDVRGEGGPPDTGDEIKDLLAKSTQETKKADDYAKNGDRLIKASIEVAQKAVAILEKKKITVKEYSTAIELGEKAADLGKQAAKSYEAAASHHKESEALYDKALGLVPKFMEEIVAEQGKLEKWAKEKKTEAVVQIVLEKLGINGGVGVGTIELFGPRLPKKPVMGSFPGTSRWSKYVATKFPMRTNTQLAGSSSVTRGLGRVAVPLMLIWVGFETSKSIHKLYMTYKDGPSEAEIQSYLNDFEKWKLENPE
jgi:RHS repeat-associated protein